MPGKSGKGKACVHTIVDSVLLYVVWYLSLATHASTLGFVEYLNVTYLPDSQAGRVSSGKKSGFGLA